MKANNIMAQFAFVYTYARSHTQADIILLFYGVRICNCTPPSKQHKSNPTPDEAQTFPKEPWCVTLFPNNLSSTCQSQSLFSQLTFVSDIARLVSPLCRVFHVAGFSLRPHEEFWCPPNLSYSASFPGPPRGTNGGPSPRRPITELVVMSSRVLLTAQTDTLSHSFVNKSGWMAWGRYWAGGVALGDVDAEQHLLLVIIDKLSGEEICECFAFVISWSFVRDSVLIPYIA